MIGPLRIAVLALMVAGVAAAAHADEMTCPAAPDPVHALSYGSRYSDAGDGSRELDAAASDEVDEELGPIDDFLRDLTDMANAVHEDGADRPAIADCVVGQIAVWARADALAALQSRTARLTIASRIAGFGLILRQVAPHTRRPADLTAAATWLDGLMRAQTVFWEESAPDGAAQGNLRAWAALAGSVTAELSENAVLRGWSTWSLAYVLCKASPDGSLPQEMSRGKHALHYQLHAIAPMVLAALLLERQGVAVTGTCGRALDRVVGFALDDLETGERTRKITGKVQSYFDGTDRIEGFTLAWIEAYLALGTGAHSARLDALAKGYRPLNYSKLGGDQTLIWGDGGS